MNSVLYITGPGGALLYEQHELECRIHQADARGSSISLVNMEGDQTNAYMYSWFGETIAESGNFDTSRKWLGIMLWTDGSAILPLTWPGAVGNWSPELGTSFGYPPRPTTNYGDFWKNYIEYGSKVDIASLFDAFSGWPLGRPIAAPPTYGINLPPNDKPSNTFPPFKNKPPVRSLPPADISNSQPPTHIGPIEPKPCASFLERGDSADAAEEMKKLIECISKSCTNGTDLEQCVFKCIFKLYSGRFAEYNCCIAASYSGVRVSPHPSTIPGFYPCDSRASGFRDASCCYYHFCTCALLYKVKFTGPWKTLPTDFYKDCTWYAQDQEGCNQSYTGPAICGDDPNLIPG